MEELAKKIKETQKKDPPSINKIALILGAIILLVFGFFAGYMVRGSVNQFPPQFARNPQSVNHNNFFTPSPTPIENPAVSIWLKNTATNTQAEELIKQLRSIDGVTRVTYTSQQDVYEQYRKENKSNSELLSLATPDIFSGSINIYLKSHTVTNEIIQLAQSEPFVQQVSTVPTLASWNITTEEWKTYTLPHEKLSFKYPPNWKVDQIPNQTQDYDAVAVSHGKYLVDFVVYKQNSYEAQPGYSMAGSLTDWTPLDSFALNNQTVYLLNEGGDGSDGSSGMTLSSCKSNAKCLIKAKNVQGYIDIMSSYVKGTTDDLAPGTIHANDPNLGIIKAIIESVHYN